MTAGVHDGPQLWYHPNRAACEEKGASFTDARYQSDEARRVFGGSLRYEIVEYRRVE